MLATSDYPQLSSYSVSVLNIPSLMVTVDHFLVVCPVTEKDSKVPIIYYTYSYSEMHIRQRRVGIVLQYYYVYCINVLLYTITFLVFEELLHICNIFIF